MPDKKISIIDETIREGMQYRGLVFSLDQRIKILEFQEALNINICQAGYPPAHDSETEAVKALNQYARKKGFRISVAGMGRVRTEDIMTLLETGISDFHFHAHIQNNADTNEQTALSVAIEKAVTIIRSHAFDPKISIAMLDIGKTDPVLLAHFVNFLANQLEIDFISLPDTSGIMAPNMVFETISTLMAPLSGSKTKISIHCHNDMGMASANSIMGIIAGGRAVEASVLGIGERNGIADLFTVAALLRKQGFETGADTDNLDTFRKYYEYINSIIVEQTGESHINYATPFFGTGVKTHVAGTHADGSFGSVPGDILKLNLLCGNHMVKLFLERNGISYNENLLSKITRSVKSESARLNRSLCRKDIIRIVSLTS